MSLFKITCPLLVLMLASAAVEAATNYAQILPGRRQAVDVPAIAVNPFVNSIQEVEKVQTKQEEVSLGKLFEEQLTHANISALFWDADPHKRSVLLNGFVLHVGDPYPSELWANGAAFLVKAIDINRIYFSVPGVADERITKQFELRAARPKSISLKSDKS